MGSRRVSYCPDRTLSLLNRTTFAQLVGVNTPFRQVRGSECNRLITTFAQDWNWKPFQRTFLVVKRTSNPCALISGAVVLFTVAPLLWASFAQVETATTQNVPTEDCTTISAPGHYPDYEGMPVYSIVRKEYGVSKPSALLLRINTSTEAFNLPYCVLAVN